MADTKRIHVLCYEKDTEPSEDKAPEKQFRTAGRGDLKKVVENLADLYELVFFATVGAGIKVVPWQKLWEQTPLSLEEAYEFLD